MLGRTNTGGGGGGLNFKVVGGTTEPDNPKENTIWVDTDVDITGYIFSATEPSDPTDGMVWITTGTSSTVEFNALKKNGIQVYPISAKQHVSGAWADKTAKSYQDGEWVGWSIYLYTPGNTFEDLTGGYKAYSENSTGSAVLNSNGMKFTVVRSGTNYGGENGFSTSKKIDLSGRSKLRCKGNLVRNGPTGFDVGVATSSSPTSNSLVVSEVGTMVAGDFDLTLDISAIDGEYYIFAKLWYYKESTGAVTDTATVSEIWLE